MLINNQSLATLKEKWVKRTENRRKCNTVKEARMKDLVEYKKEKNVLLRKEGEVWKCGDAYKMEWTHSPL